MRPILLALVLLLAIGCAPRDRNTWHPAPPGGESSARVQRANEAPPRATAVVFAPVAISTLAEILPSASTSFAYDLADRVDVLGAKADADGLAAPNLPVSDDLMWRTWPVEGTRGASLVVLTTVQSITRNDGAPNAQGVRHVSCTAIVEMRGLDGYGNVVFSKRGRGDWEGHPSPKFPGPEARPEPRAVWQACSNAVGALIEFLEKRNEAATSGSPQPATEALVEVSIDSEPAGADVLVDGIFRGNTPCVLKLPARRLLLRLERPGHGAWERTIVPDPGMRIKPVLEPQR